MSEVVLPELGEGIEKAVVACWHVKRGDRVNAGDDIVELVTDKATFNVSAPIGGRIEKIYFEEGKEVKIGASLASINAV